MEFMHYRKIVDSLRKFRTWHRTVGIGVALFTLVSASTGILLGWKKDIELIQPPEQKARRADLSRWVHINEIVKNAEHALDSVVGEPNEVDKLDVRPSKGIVKVLFKNGYWEVQIEGATGKALSVAQRHSDWIEHVHDGSIIGDVFKVAYTNLLGWGLLLLSLTGAWMWYGPSIVKKIKYRGSKN